jgi:RNA polymerase sigma factor (sigma-70 family)
MCNCTTGKGQAAQWFHQAQAGDKGSLEQLMRQHDRLVHYILRQQSSGPLGYEELLQAGRIGLWRAIEGFDPERGIAFSTYASVAIARHIWQAVARAQQEARRGDVRGKSWKEAAPPSRLAPDPLKYLLAQEVRVALYALLEHLPNRQRWIVCSYYGLEGQVPYTQAQLAAELGCTRQAVSYHLHRALLRLRHPAFSAALRVLLGRNRRRDYWQALRPDRRRA